MEHEFNVGDLVRVKRGPSSWSLAIIMNQRENGSYWVRFIPDEPVIKGTEILTGRWFGAIPSNVFPVKPSNDRDQIKN